MKRISSIDFTRGLVMIIMALDHSRDLLHVSSIQQNPTDLSSTTPFLFFTRWITHLCAPTFVFLAGTSVYLASKKKGDFTQYRRFLFKRGLFLIAIEFTVMNLGMFMDIGFHLLFFEVIAAIGLGFIILSVLLGFSAKTIATVGLAILFLHDLLLFIPLKEGSLVITILSAFYRVAAIPLFSGHSVLITAYPPLPWLGIMLVGYGAGIFFESNNQARKKIFFRLGCLSILLFIIVRWINMYGDPFPWSGMPSPIYSFLSFMNVTKYPPSLLFSLITLGVMFLLLRWGENAGGQLAGIASTYGRAPLFYFVVHFYLIHLILLAILFLQGFHWSQLEFSGGTFGRPKGAVSGIPLYGVYLVWIAVVAVLYRPCKWFVRYKARHSGGWLKYV